MLRILVGIETNPHWKPLNTPACSWRSVLYRAAWNSAQAFSMLVSRRRGLGHAIRRSGCEMRAPILDQPVIAVAGGHVEKVDRYHGDGRPIWTVDIVHGKERVDDRDIGFDEADAIVGERRLRATVDGLLGLGTEVLHHCDHHCDPPLQEVTHRRHEGSIFGE